MSNQNTAGDGVQPERSNDHPDIQAGEVIEVGEASEASDTPSREPGLLRKFFAIPGVLTVVSMLIFAGFYWYFFALPLWVAVGFTVGLLIHEMGHMVVFWHYKMKTSPPVFAPFVGAVISMKEEASNAWAEAWIGLGGPIGGTIAAAFAYLAFQLTGSEDWLTISILCCSLNLMNMLPLSPLDGGHITGAIWRWFWLIGILAIAGLAIVTGSTMLTLVVLVGMTEIDKKILPLNRWLWVALLAGMGVLAYSWSNPWILIPATFALTAVRNRFRRRTLMIHVPDKDASGEDEFQLVYAAMKSRKELAGITEDSARVLWTAHFNGKPWSSVVVDDLSISFKLVPAQPGEETSSPAAAEGTPAGDQPGSEKPKDEQPTEQKPIEAVVEVAGPSYRVVFVNTGYFDIPLWQRLVIGGVYGGLIAVLLYMIADGIMHLQPVAVQAGIAVGLY